MRRAKTQSSSSGGSDSSHEQTFLHHIYKRANSIDHTPPTTPTITKKSLMSAIMSTTKSVPTSSIPVTPPLLTIVPPEINDPTLFRPHFGRVKTNAVWGYSTIRGWLTKHIPPSYSFTKSLKLRYVVLADRMLYTFKTDSPTPFYREFFELTGDTDVFVSDHLSGVMYCIEISKKNYQEHKTWYLQCENAESMKLWLDRLKKTVSWLKNSQGPSLGIVTPDLTYKERQQQQQKNQQNQQQQDQQRFSGVNSSSSDSILSVPSSLTFLPISFRRNTQSTDDTEIASSLDYQDLFYADEYDEWEPPCTIVCQALHQTTPVHHHRMILPPQRPPPMFAPPPPPTPQKLLV